MTRLDDRRSLLRVFAGLAGALFLARYRAKAAPEKVISGSATSRS